MNAPQCDTFVGSGEEVRSVRAFAGRDSESASGGSIRCRVAEPRGVRSLVRSLVRHRPGHRSRFLRCNSAAASPTLSPWAIYSRTHSSFGEDKSRVLGRGLGRRRGKISKEILEVVLSLATSLQSPST